MNSLYLALIMLSAYLIAYHTYGKFLAKKIFKIDKNAICPSLELQDNCDFVPTDKQVLFGHHFTSIAGLGPIVGPSIAIIWGWIPAVIWVLFGSIFMGAIHDFGSLVISLRSKGSSIGDIAGNLINPRVKNLFLLIIFFELWIVIAIFALIIAILFTMYPQAVIPVWFQIPIAITLGYFVYKRQGSHLKLGIIAVIIMYLSIILGAYFPIVMPSIAGFSSISIWIIILLIYAYIASIIPVQVLLQPRDYINSHQLLIAMTLLGIGTFIARPEIVAPPLNLSPEGAPPVFPFLFVIIACGAISGFHSLVSSGTSSKQCDNENSALYIGFGGMLLEGSLSTLVIIAVAGGIGIALKTNTGEVLQGVDAFSHHYSSWASANGLSAKLGAFITGSVNIISSLGISPKITKAIMGVFLVSFAATTLDSATRIQRYIITEMTISWKLKFLSGKHSATLIAVVSAFILAFYNGSGKGALTLWPLFGSVNQLLAALSLLVITIYLTAKKQNSLYAKIPLIFMIFMTGWAMSLNIIKFYQLNNWILFFIGVSVFVLEIWMVIESLVLKNK